MIKAIFACDDKWGIGKNNSLPWSRNSADLRWFRQCTDGQAVVMGRKTWESLPIRPLPNRINLVITSKNAEHYTPMPHGTYSGKDVCKIVKDVIEKRYSGIDDLWIIGGAQLFESCIPIIDEVYLSRIEGDYDCDVFLPKWKLMRNFTLDTQQFTKENLYIQKWIKRYG